MRKFGSVVRLAEDKGQGRVSIFRFMRLTDKVAIITGAASGIGEACALLFAKEGARVVVGDFDAPQGERVARQICGAGGSAVFQSVDVSSWSQVERLVETVTGTFGRADVLVNAAGVLLYGTVLETDEAAWNRVMDINLKGTFFCCRAVIPEMVRQGGGSIVNFSSTTGAHDACAHAVAYVASKGGVAALTRAISIDHARQGVRINAICPGPTDTPMLRKALTPEALVDFARSFPMGRLGSPREIAAAALFLASDESSFMTGSMLTVDGGQTAEV
jgi:NAD(P)-dependent dehydrogenase (short-subunit alcohol dehydrogenase family)